MPRKPAPTIPWWASDDPWVLTPDEQIEADETQRQRAEEAARTPNEPPF